MDAPTILALTSLTASDMVSQLNLHISTVRPNESEVPLARSIALAAPVAAAVLLGHCVLVLGISAADFVDAADIAFTTASPEALCEVGAVQSASPLFFFYYFILNYSSLE